MLKQPNELLAKFSLAIDDKDIRHIGPAWLMVVTLAPMTKAETAARISFLKPVSISMPLINVRSNNQQGKFNRRSR